MLCLLSLKVLLYILSIIIFKENTIVTLLIYLWFYIVSIAITYFSWITVLVNCLNCYNCFYITSIIVLMSEYINCIVYLFLKPTMFYVPIYVLINASSVILIKYYYTKLKDSYEPIVVTTPREITTRVIRVGANHRSSGSNSVCSICLDGFRRRQRICILPCGHTFHNKCIKRWIKRENKCPECIQYIETAKLLKTGGLLEIQKV
jgi:hypothetical protein